MHTCLQLKGTYIASVYYDTPLGYTFRSQIIDKLSFNEHCCPHTTYFVEDHSFICLQVNLLQTKSHILTTSKSSCSDHIFIRGEFQQSFFLPSNLRASVRSPWIAPFALR